MKRIDGSLVFLLVLAVGGATLCFLLKGPDAFKAAAMNELGLLMRILPVMAGALLLGGFLQALVPPAVVRRWLGDGSRLRGILIATAAGACVPGGPTTSFPLVLTLVTAGADAGVVIAFITAWAVLGLNRVVVWELPFMGSEFAVLRYLVSLSMPIIAGLLARRVPIAIRPPVRSND
jgi:uncharacterized membrane protein YraQ (UPF0718 family)